MTGIDVFNVRPHQEKKPHGFKALASQWTLLKPRQWHLLLYRVSSSLAQRNLHCPLGGKVYSSVLSCSACTAFSNNAIKARLSGFGLEYVK